MRAAALLFALLICGASLTHAQSFQFKLDQSIPVLDDNLPYESPWNGGLNSPEFSTMDLNFDGKDDLVIYDRTAQKVITYINRSGKFVSDPTYETLFPADVYNWLLLRDFNCDGLKDIFTGNIFGIAVYQNVSTDGNLKWEKFLFYDGNASSDVVLTQGLSGRINLQIQFDDLPSISDVDGDGDLDIFVMNYGGSGTIQFHKNLSNERYGVCDSLDFELVDSWWGDVRECDCNEFAFNRSDCFSGGRIDHAGGKSLTMMDVDGDGFNDMLISEGECAVLNVLDNDGTTDAPLIVDSPWFPPGATDPLPLYPTPYFEDLDFDGVRDVLIASNIFSKSDYSVDLSQSAWFYKNNGTNESPSYVLQTKSFLQNSMIDEGDNVVVAFADVDGDSDYDMFISNNELPSTIIFYRNTGTPFAPEFKREDGDYLGLSVHQLSLMKIQFADINADGKIDLVMTATKTSQNFTDVYYILNKQSKGLDFSNQTLTRLNFQVVRSENISFVHVDSDGRIDLLKGKANGAVEYWRNVGPMQFALENSEFLGMGPDVFSTRRSFASADLNADGKPDLIIGDESGRLRIIPAFREAIASDVVTDIILNETSNEYYAANLGGRLWPTTVNLYGTTKPVIAVGTVLGGVRLLRSVSDETEELQIGMYPNPVAPDLEELTIVSSRPAQLSIISSNGKELRSGLNIPSKEVVKLPLDNFAAGLYFFRFSVDNKTIVRRLVVH